MSEQTLRILLVDYSTSYVQPLSEILRVNALSAHVEQVKTLDAFQTALKSSAWDVVLSAYSTCREILPVIEGKFPVIVLCETQEEDEALGLTEPSISDILPITHLKRLPFILRRELRLNRRQSQVALQESEAKYRLLAENMADVIWTLDTTTMRFTYVSPSVERLRGYTPDEVLSQSMDEVVTPASRTLIDNSLADRLPAFLNGDPTATIQTHEVEQICKDGSTVWTEVVTTLLKDSTGNVQVLGVSRDISQRKRSEEALQESEGRYQRILDNLLEGFQIIDFDWRYFYVNDSAALHGRQAKEDLLGHTIMERYPGIEETEMFAVLQRCMQDRTFDRIENEFTYPDGTTAWFELSIEPVPEGIVVFSIDITRRKESENALLKSEQTLRLFIEHAPAAIAMFDHDMRYLSVSRRWLTDYRLSEQNIIGRSHYDVFPDLPDRWKEIHQRCLKGGVEKCEADPFPRADGTLDWVHWEIYPWRDHDVKIGGIVLFSEVITDRKQAEDSIRRLNRMLDMISDINQVIVRIRHMPSLFEKACQTAVDKGNFCIAWIGLLDEKARQVKIVACAGGSAESLAKHQFVLGSSLYGRSKTARSLRAGEHVIWNDVGRDARTTRWRKDVLSLDCHAVGVFPLKVRGEVHGIMGLYASEADFFDEAELRLLDEMADDISFAMEFAEQDEQRQQAEGAVKLFAQRMETLHQIDIGLIQGNSIEALVESTLQHIREIIPCQTASVALFDWALGEVSIVALNLQNPAAIAEITRVPLPPGSLEQFGSDTQLVIDDLRLLQEPTPVQQTLIEEGLCSALYILLPGQEQSRGSFSLASDTVGFFTPEYQEIATEVSNQLAIGIRQWDLSQELAQHAALLEQRVTQRTNELQVAKERVEAILNSSPDGILLIRTDLLIDQTNQTFNQLFACEADDYFHRSFFDLVHPEDMAHAKEVIQACFAEDVDQSLEIRARRQDGTVFAAELSMGHIKTDGLVCIIRDITERKAQERQLRYHASLQENVSDAVIGLDMEFRIQSWNRAAERVYGWSAEEVIGKPIVEIIPVENSFQVDRERSAQQLYERSWWQGEIVQCRKDGSIRHILGAASLIKDDEGVPFGVVAVNHDITERKQTEEALKKSAAEIHDLYNNAPCGYHSLDTNGVIVQINDTELRWLGYSREEVVDKLKVTDIFTPESVQTFQANFPAFKDRGWVNDLEFDLVCKDGSLIHILLNGTAIYDEQGQYVKSRSSVFDITELKHTEANLSVKMEEEREFRGYLKALHEITIELAQIDQLDEFYKRVIELGLQRLGHERMSLFLYDAEQELAVGTYGTDTQGKLVAEHALQFVAAPDGIMGQAFERDERIYIEEDTPLTGSRLERVGQGWNAAAVLWNGTQRLGWLVTDNLLTHRPASKPMLETLSLYALTVGTLLGRVQAETALRESEGRFRLIAENIDEVLFMRSGDNQKMLYVSPLYETLTGKSCESLYDNPDAFLEIVHPDDLDYVLKQLKAQRYAEMGLADFEYRIIHTSGHVRWIRMRTFPIRDDDGTILRRAGTIEDITERKKAEEALKESEARFRHVVEAAPDYVLMYDTTGIIQMVNPATLSDSGYTQDEMIGHDIAEFFPPETRDLFERELLHTLETGSHHYEGQIVRKDGSMALMDGYGSVIIGEEGQPQSIIVLKRDVTQRKQIEEALRQALAKEKELNELKSRFVSMASHEFRTPLATILTATETLTAYRHRLTDEKIDQRLDRIKEQVGYLKDIMEDVLWLAKMQARRVVFEPVLLDLNAFCRSVLHEFRSRPDIEHELIYTCTGEIREVRLDRKLMRQIISNIVHNAIKYSPTEQPITIHLEYTSKTVILTVRDTGIGIPETDQKHLFEPFHRAANVGSISGTGLGLVIVKESVELHGGTIAVESQVGVGTTIAISLPIHSEGELDDGQNSSH